MNKILNLDNRWLDALNRIATSNHFLQTLTKDAAEYLIYIIPLLLVVVWFYSAQSKKVALRALGAGGLGLLITRIIGQNVNRARPFAGTGGIKEILFHRPDYSFPSDHATLLAAITLSLYLSGYKKLSYFVFALFVIIGLARVAAGIHFPSDIIVGGVVGIGTAYIVYALDGLLNYIYEFIILVAKKIRLA